VESLLARPHKVHVCIECLCVLVVDDGTCLSQSVSVWSVCVVCRAAAVLADDDDDDDDDDDVCSQQ